MMKKAKKMVITKVKIGITSMRERVVIRWTQ